MFTCENCNKSYVRKNNLEKHNLICKKSLEETKPKKETKEEIGDYLEEILNGDDEFIQYQLNSIEANNQMKDNLPF